MILLSIPQRLPMSILPLSLSISMTINIPLTPNLTPTSLPIRNLHIIPRIPLTILPHAKPITHRIRQMQHVLQHKLIRPIVVRRPSHFQLDRTHAQNAVLVYLPRSSPVGSERGAVFGVVHISWHEDPVPASAAAAAAAAAATATTATIDAGVAAVTFVAFVGVAGFGGGG